MKEISVFDKLVSELSQSERQNMLERIESSVILSDEPVYEESQKEEGYVSLDSELLNLGLFKKIILLIQAVFTGKKAVDIIKERNLKAIARNIEERIPGLINYKQGRLSAKFHLRLTNLKEKMRQFTDVLDSIFSKNKSDFFAFMAGREMPQIQDRIFEETDPYKVADEREEINEKELYKELQIKLENIFYDISEEDRNIMYTYARRLSCIKALTYFPYERILSAFPQDASGATDVAFVSVKDQLLELTDILTSLHYPPSKNLLENMYLFHYQNKLHQEEFNLEQELSKGLKEADQAVAELRAFNNDIPLIKIMKLMTEDLNYSPNQISGGEDWFALFKDFWEARIDKLFNRFSKDRKRQQLQKRVFDYLGSFELADLSRYRNGAWGEGLSVQYGLCMRFLVSFYERILLVEINRPLKILLIDGEFYKEENRSEYTDAYNGVMRIKDMVYTLDRKLSEKGELGQQIAEAQKEVGNSTLRKRKISAVLATADKEAELIIRKVLDNLNLLASVVNGILYGEVGGKYDTLSNLGYIGGRKNKQYMKDLDKALNTVNKAYELLSELFELEQGTAL